MHSCNGLERHTTLVHYIDSINKYIDLFKPKDTPNHCLLKKKVINKQHSN